MLEREYERQQRHYADLVKRTVVEVAAVEQAVREKEQQLMYREQELLEVARRRQLEEQSWGMRRRAQLCDRESEQLEVAVGQVLPEAIERLRASVKAGFPRLGTANAQLLRTEAQVLSRAQPIEAGVSPAYLVVREAQIRRLMPSVE